MPTVSKMDPVFAPKAPAEVMGRHRGGEYEGAWTTGACRSIPVVDPMQREAARATFRSRTFNSTHALATPQFLPLEHEKIENPKKWKLPKPVCSTPQLPIPVLGSAFFCPQSSEPRPWDRKQCFFTLPEARLWCNGRVGPTIP